MNKKAVSQVVITILLVAISIMIVAIAGVTIMNLVSQNAEQTSFEGATSKFNIQKAEIQENNVQITVERGVGGGKLKYLKFIFKNKTNEIEVQVKSTMSQLSTNVFDVAPEGIDPSTITSVTVIPIFETSEGTIKDTYIIDEPDEIPEPEITPDTNNIQTLDLVAYWKAENNAEDSSGNNNHGILNGDTSYLENSFNLDGDGDCIKIEDSNSLDVEEITIKTEIYLRSYPTQTASYIISKMNDWKNEMSYLIYIDTLGKINAFISEDGNTAGLGEITTGSIDLNKWYNLTFTYSNGDYRIYINGQEASSNNEGSAQGNIHKGSGKLTIGARYDESELRYNYFFNGQIKEIKIYNRSLNDSEISENIEIDSNILKREYYLDARDFIGITSSYGEEGRWGWDNYESQWSSSNYHGSTYDDALHITEIRATNHEIYINFTEKFKEDFISGKYYIWLLVNGGANNEFATLKTDNSLREKIRLQNINQWTWQEITNKRLLIDGNTNIIKITGLTDNYLYGIRGIYITPFEIESTNIQVNPSGNIGPTFIE
jgi:uncharacterized protein YdeI (BOF family)